LAKTAGLRSGRFDAMHVIASLSGELRQQSGAISQAFRWGTHSVQYGEKQIGHGRLLIEPDVATELDGAPAAAGQENGQVIVVMGVAAACRNGFRSSSDGGVSPVTVSKPSSS
jgi:hypothetical protein